MVNKFFWISVNSKVTNNRYLAKPLMDGFMNRWFFRTVLFLLFIGSGFCYALTFPSHFDFSKKLRVDFVLAGNDQHQSGFIVHLSQFNQVEDDMQQLISPFDFGEYRVFVIHPLSRDTLYKKGFSTLFEEWRTIKEATVKTRAFEQTLILPFPNQKIELEVEARTREGSFVPLFKEIIDPNSLAITPQKKSAFQTKIIFGEDNPSQKVDLLFVAEGYTAEAENKFFADVERLSKMLFKIEPYASRRGDFTIRAVAAVSDESGTDDPSANVWRNTLLNSSFNTFGVDRYLETESLWKIHDVVTGIPHDHIIVLVNSKKYGGGGIYNHFSIVTSNNPHSATVLIHELGHGLAGLGDEYFGVDVTYSDYINLEAEPWQPNLTTLIDFDRKWKSLVSENTPIPTPIRPAYEKITGVFEGGGYTSKGVYRPSIHCRMRTNEADGFCEVCQQTIGKVIDFYIQPSNK